METRNLIKSGPSTYVISVPSDWIKKNHLKKKDQLYLEQKPDHLIYYVGTKKEENKEYTIEIDGKSEEQILRWLKSAYLMHYNTFILHGNSVKNRIQEIRKILNQLIAVEIMEQGSTRIVAHELLDKSKNSPEKIIRRMDMIIRSNLMDVKASIGNASAYQIIKERDLDVNRLHMLARRIIGLNSEEIVDSLLIFKMTDLLEMIADSVREISKVSNLDKQATEIFSSVEQAYTDILTNYYKDNAEAAIDLSIFTQKLIHKLENYLKNNKSLTYFEFITPLRDIVLYLNEIALITLNKNT